MRDQIVFPSLYMLTCKAEYDTKQCGRIDAFWCHHTLEECPKLIDLGKYLTVVNEMVMEDYGVRHRHVVTDFIELTPADRGVYQCNAVCEMGGHTAMGHYINITVKGTITFFS
uniref:Ig-like domain-containing protein n=1 Tax=Oncorhynchus kisutch TaxID=8019 RepID=A0A8C7CTQ3_ONCKI